MRLRHFLVVLALLGPLLAMLPILGLVFGLIDPPDDIFGEAPTWAEAWQRAGGGELLLRTLALALCVTGIALPLGGWLAYVEQRLEMPGRRILCFAALLPFAMPSYLIAATLREQVGRLTFVGFWPAVLTLVVITTPYVQLVVGAALARTNGSAEDAARTLGARRNRILAAITIPRIRPALAFAGVITALYVIGEFGAVAMLNCQVLTWRLYHAATTMMQLPVAIMLGLMLIVLALPLIVAAIAIHGRVRPTANASASSQPARQHAGPVTTVVTWALLLLVIGLGVVVPVLTLMQWVLEGWSRGVEMASVWPPIRDTLFLALGGGALTVALVALPAWLSGQRRSRLAAALEPAVLAASAVPGILIGFGLLQFAIVLSRAFDSPELYKLLVMGGPLILVAFAIRFLAEAYGGPKATATLVDSRQLDAARILGAKPFRRWRVVAFPVMAPGFAAAFVIATVSIARELPITLMLATRGGFRPLSHRMYDRYMEAHLMDAGVAGLILVGLAALALVVGARWRRYAG